MLETLLKQLGLSDYEARIYTVLHSNSPAGASFIAKKCNLSRSSVYTTLNSLISQGLVSTTYKNEVKQFIAQGYPALEQLLKKEKTSVDQKFKALESMKETLKVFSQEDLNIPQVMFFEGQEGLKRIYLSMLRQAKPDSTMYILRDEFVWEDDWNFVFKKDWHDRIKRWRTEKNVKTRLLVNPSKLEKAKQKFYRGKKGLEFRILPPKNQVSQFAMYLINDMVSILSMENNNLVGILITNQHLAKNFENLFGILWNKSN